MSFSPLSFLLLAARVASPVHLWELVPTYMAISERKIKLVFQLAHFKPSNYIRLQACANVAGKRDPRTIGIADY